MFFKRETMLDKQEISAIAAAQLPDESLFLVDVTVTPDNRISVEIDGDRPVSIDDCIALSRTIESCLDRDVEDFELEVGSCGITAPFKVLRQYRKNIGNEIEVVLKNGLKVKGLLNAVSDESITLLSEKTVKPEGAKRKTTITEPVVYPFEEIKNAKYLIRFK